MHAYSIQESMHPLPTPSAPPQTKTKTKKQNKEVGRSDCIYVKLVRIFQ